MEAKQEVIRPGDAYLLMGLATAAISPASYGELARRMGVAASAAHSSVARLSRAGLLGRGASTWAIRRPALVDFICHGARYCYPVHLLHRRRGLATGVHALKYTGELAMDDEDVHVWPDPEGKHVGAGLVPLHPSAPAIARCEPELREALALFDLLRVGGARERRFAIERLRSLLGD